ncbi:MULTISPECIES: ABC transporter ATP-binding protein [Rhodopseudomonas]|uniref:Cobalt ABC transporter ATPase n=1 Tax=Rhodopseudomonas palustris TaxID=1076 RepID=A0A0D7F6D4_RHOPL|nr:MULTISPECIES: ABC transporter ATP-binding protein [Rhodopseudomonas]KIZ47267.1 cobalt ABC transporter ATPase [Rhodopseudomonas palustris]MDF3810704.1 ABC transporter ATP-binding protein [Rhodopseudomonas sp. BAL398]WOK18494.1 ABC transporter ATP-binding protein [Rhodopseudomonas sp. BAL398]
MPLFDVRGIVFAYPGQPNVLDGVDLALHPSERLCVVGPNGAGKSTLLQILVGLLLPRAGTVTAFGSVRRVERDFHDVRRRAGFVFQDPDDQLFCPTVAEDVAFGPRNLGKTRQEAAMIVDATLEQLELSHLRDRVTHKLSGGEKRLVTLAAVLAMQPEVLLLDEPTNALDERIYGRLIDILTGLPQAMIVVSHDPHFRRAIGTRSVGLGDGRLSALDETSRVDARIMPRSR